MVTAAVKQLQAVSAELEPELQRLFDVGDAELPEEAREYLAKAAKNVGFSTTKGSQYPASAATLLAIYGFHDRAAATARLLLAVPNTGNMTIFEPLQSGVCAVAFFATDPTVRSEIGTRVVAHYAPHPGRLKGAGMPLRREKLASAREKPEHYPPIYQIDMLRSQIQELATMYIYGGSLFYRKKKIAAEINGLRAELFAIPGWGAATTNPSS